MVFSISRLILIQDYIEKIKYIRLTRSRLLIGCTNCFWAFSVLSCSRLWLPNMFLVWLWKRGYFKNMKSGLSLLIHSLDYTMSTIFPFMLIVSSVNSKFNALNFLSTGKSFNERSSNVSSDSRTFCLKKLFGLFTTESIPKSFFHVFKPTSSYWCSKPNSFDRGSPFLGQVFFNPKIFWSAAVWSDNVREKRALEVRNCSVKNEYVLMGSCSEVLLMLLHFAQYFNVPKSLFVSFAVFLSATSQFLTKIFGHFFYLIK